MYNTETPFGSKYHHTRFYTEAELKEEEARYAERRAIKHYGLNPGQCSDEAYRYALRSAGDIHGLFQCIEESLRELKFKGYEKLYISITISSDTSSERTMYVKLSALSNIQEWAIQKVLVSNHMFHLGVRFEDICNIFDLIRYWKNSIRKEMADRLKDAAPPELFDKEVTAKRKRK